MSDWTLEIVEIRTGALLPNPDNPNEQDDETFNALCDAIEEEGFLDPLQVVQLYEKEVLEAELDPAQAWYRIVGGEHRWRAAKVVGLEFVPCTPLDPERWDKDRQDWNLVKLNILNGALNPEKFTALYSKMVQRYDAETLQALMGFTTQDAFQKVFKSVKDALPPGLQDALDAAKDEIRTIDDLTLVLNRLFQEFGETLPSNFMVFSWGGREVMWVQASAELWHRAKEIAAMVDEHGLDMSTVLFESLAKPDLAEQIALQEGATP